MKQIISVLLLAILLTSISGCAKEEGEIIPQTNKETISIVENSDKSDETTVQNVAKENDVDDSKVLDTADYSAAEAGTEETDEGLKADAMVLVEKLYFNFFFEPDTVRGEITEDDMLSFAISYIYQYEYNELRFDSDTFTLFIPEENISSVIRRFFDYEFTNHRYPALDKVTYEDGFYLVPAQDIHFADKPVLKKINRIDEATYKVFFADTSSDYEVVVKKLDDRLIVRNYKKIEAAAAQ